MLVGYAGVNSAGQSLAIQLRTLSEAGCAKVFSEEQSWMSVGARNALQRALDFVREGDTLVVTQLDHLTRFASNAHDMIACRDVRSILSPGATIIVTADSLISAGMAQSLTVIETDPSR